MSNINSTIEARGRHYGEFEDGASIMQQLKKVMRNTAKWDLLAPDMQEALEMVCHKAGRILNGDPEYVDSWHDIAGYALLVEQRLVKSQTLKNNVVAEPVVAEPYHNRVINGSEYSAKAGEDGRILGIMFTRVTPGYSYSEATVSADLKRLRAAFEGRDYACWRAWDGTLPGPEGYL